MIAYANPPWCLLGRVLAKFQQHHSVELLLIAPVWPSQPWYPVLVDLLIDFPCLILQCEDMMINIGNGDLPKVTPQLAAWHISNIATLQRRFQNQLQISSWHNGGRNLAVHMTQYPVAGPVSEVANILANLYEEGYQYRSLNSYRSAISSAHDRVDGLSIGQHPLITRLMAGAFNSRPAQPRYSTTWDVNKVVIHLKNLCLNQALSLKDLTLKTVMILALTRPSRSPDPCLLDVDHFRQRLEGISFIPVGLSKQAKGGRFVREFLFPKFLADESICPVRHYMERTEPLRMIGPVRNSSLFLSWIKPHDQYLQRR